ncbi:oxygen-dependent coproporphyrinogen-III oxidase, chloroplastic [Phragmites australis]|uniref:oxygen-dependent coproporphyrinogen-III oxidase, chloroplastic n=1 Tax=Phragmites australis TaxID=29695 RepID=UPI002D76CA93|nr:oxygen-dependent coproporphyrinogen-III oxidase, chloroplastic [Phragmites australis]
MASSLFSTPSQTLAPAPATARLRVAPPAQVPFPRLPRRVARGLRVRSSVAIEKETPESEPPQTFLREDGRGAGSGSVRERFEAMIRRVQGEICAALEEADGSGAQFVEDVWSRPGGGGGISRVLQDGRVFEKAGVNVSVVYGVMPPDAYRAAKGEAGKNGAADGHKAGPVPFFAAGISSVLHPKNPFAPTLHFNYRYFETDAPKDAPGAPRQWWFGGGTDLTPSYIIEEDVKHFHSVQKQACDKFDLSFYPKFKKWCDDYFCIKHRNERRGLGGIFFDDLNDYDQEMLLGFATECADSVLPAYIPIIERRKDTPFNEEHKAWQQLRRGRYVEFNLVYDRGTTFGLKTGGRIESILVSLPLTARWQYDHKPERGTEEWKLLDACMNPKEWI